jgi:methylmalonyl-CoA mutase, N-terminal domain
VLGGTQSLHTNSMDEVLALPTEKAARIALRTQQVIGFETGVTHVADPLGGAWFVEELTDELERQAETIFAHLDRLGRGSILEGVFEGIDNSYFQKEIAEAAYELEKKVNSGRRVVVGVNRFTDGSDEVLDDILRISPEVEERQLKRLEQVKADRDGESVEAGLAQVAADAAQPDVNLMPSLIDAVRTYATVGEIVDALAGVYGRWQETPVV